MIYSICKANESIDIGKNKLKKMISQPGTKITYQYSGVLHCTIAYTYICI